MALMDAEPSTNIAARTRLTSHPVTKLVPVPVITMGRKQIDVWIAESD